MATINKLPMRVHLNCSPDELRKLADKMEAKIASTAIGESTLVEVWSGEDLDVLFYFNPEAAALRAFSEVPITQIRAGDVIAATPQMPFNVALLVEGCRIDPKNQCWELWSKGQHQPYRFTDLQLETLRFQVRRKR